MSPHNFWSGKKESYFNQIINPHRNSMAGLEHNLYFLDFLSNIFPIFLCCCSTFHQQPKTLDSASDWLVWWEVKDVTLETSGAPMMKNRMNGCHGPPSSVCEKFPQPLLNTTISIMTTLAKGSALQVDSFCFHKSTKLTVGGCRHLPWHQPKKPGYNPLAQHPVFP